MLCITGMAETPPMTALNNVQAAEATAAAAEEYSARRSMYNHYRPLHKALLQGDWTTARGFIDREPHALTGKIIPNGMTALQVAAAGGRWRIVEKLAQKMPREALAVQDLVGCTALHYVSIGGSRRAAEALVGKNPSLTRINNLAEQTPFLLAITSCWNKKLVWYLALGSANNSLTCPFSSSSVGYLLAALTAAGYHDITWYLVQLYPQLATVSDENGNCILYALSQMPSEFNLKLWERWIYPCIPSAELDHSPPSQTTGNIEDPHGNSRNDQYYFGSLFWKAIDKLGICPAEPPPVQTRGDVEDPHRRSRNHRYNFGSLFWKAIEKLVPCGKPVRHKKLRYQSAVRLVKDVCSQALTRNDLEFGQSFGAPNILLNAASCGNVEIIRICFKFSPNLVWNYIPNEGYMIQVAIKNRQEKVFNLMCKMPICRSFVLLVDESQNTTSHLAARVSPSSQLKCPALQLQKDLQWFKAVESLDHPFHKEAKNKGGKTPWRLFRDEHKGMLEQAEKWMKKTSTSCMLVAALIATVAFAASITIPGGTDQQKGYPVLWGDTYLTVFAVSDALAFFSSVFSLMAFLSILIAPYSEEDFLVALPERLILGVAALLFALLSTMVAFAIAVSFLFKFSFIWMYLMTVALAVLPFHLCWMLQLTLILKMAKTTYGQGIYSR